MSHNALIIDSDAHFTIDAITRQIRNTASAKLTVIQYDHNSERFTFSLPRFVEGHDMLEVDKAEVHYINIATDKSSQKADVYEITDLRLDTEDESKVIGSWLLSQNATGLVGSLNFLLRFSCVDDEGNLEYVWNTAIFAGISVSTGMYNSGAIVEEYADVLEQWKQELFSTKVDGNTFANAIKKTVLGKELTIEDVSPVEHELDVRVISKNRFCFSGDMVNASYGGLTFNAAAGSSTLIVNGSFTGQGTGNYNFTTSAIDLPAGTYTMSISGISSGRINLNKFDTVQQKYVNVVSTSPQTFAFDEATTVRIQIIIPVGSVYQNESITIQIENGSTATNIVDFAIPKGVAVTVSNGEEVQSRAVHPDGIVHGLMSMHPVMNIQSNNNDVLIECVYSASTKSAILAETEKVSGEQAFSMLRLEQGGIDPKGNLTPSLIQIRTIDFIHLSKLVVVPDGFNIYRVVYYNEQSGAFDSVIVPAQSDGGAVTRYTVGKEGCKAKLVISRSDTTKLLTPDDLQSIRVLNEFEKRISTLEVVSPVEFEYDHNMIDASSYTNGVTMSPATGIMTEVYNKFDELIASHAGYVSKVDAATFVGLTYPEYASNYKTYMYKLSATLPSAANSLSPKKKLLLVGGVHGDEPASIVNLYIFAKRLCEDCLSDANFFKLRSNFDIYIVPCVNGYGILNGTRQNANSVNLNRNFPTSSWAVVGAVGDRDYSGASGGSEFETQLVMKLVQNIKPTLFIDHHSYGLDGRQFYVGNGFEELNPIVYRSYTDCSAAFKKNKPEYFGSNFGFVEGQVDAATADSGQSSRWIFEQGVLGGVIEVSMCINYNGGAISDTRIDWMGNDAFSVAEYTLRNVVMRWAEYALNHEK